MESDFVAEEPASVLPHVLDLQRDGLLIMPSCEPRFVRVLQIRHATRGATKSSEPELMYEATGFLGLTDSLYQPEPEKPRPWWRRIRSAWRH